jgi:hypothetical protein
MWYLYLPYFLASKIHQEAVKARRANRTWRYIAWSLVAGAMNGLMIGIGVVIALFFAAAGVWSLVIIIGTLLVLPVVTAWLARHVTIPLGSIRLSYGLGALCRTGKDGVAYGHCLAAWAHAVKPTPKGEAWLARVRDKRIPMGDAEIVMTALFAAGRGDGETARQLMRSTAMIAENHPSVRELAGEWLAVDAAERGAWAELYADARRFPASPLAYFLEGVAARLLGAAGAPTAGELRARWLLAPHRTKTRGLFERALAGNRAPSAPRSEAVEVVDAEPLPRAVAAHLRIASNGSANATSLAAAVGAWDAALGDPATRSWLARRALELDAPLGAVDRALREVTTAVTDDLAKIADRAQLGAPAAHGPVGDALSRRLRHGRLDALEAGFTRWAQRRSQGDARAAIDEWREWIALRAAYLAAVEAGGVELRRLAFPHAFSTGNSMAAWLWNARHEYALSHAISRWLLDEARAVGDTEAIELGHRNCSLTIHTRLGKILPD